LRKEKNTQRLLVYLHVLITKYSIIKRNTIKLRSLLGGYDWTPLTPECYEYG